ncbi:hypothetical protein ACQKOM_06540 [Peribacillus frigoritolerans]|uniref:hypothetical protein n=1 Tax=Peribacillus frigoritolerans TaxID=450367 RepID=UPI003CFD16D9
MAPFAKIVVFKRNYLRLIGAEVRYSCGSSGTGEPPQAFTPRRPTARTKESENLEGKSTTTHYLVNSNKVCENSLYFLVASLADITFYTNFLSFLYPILSKVNAKYIHRNFYFYIPV